jgi:ribosomal protein S18 acetylase RimI-like enzyme
MEWLRAMFEVEPLDQALLSNPQAHVIDRGGHILFARLGEQIVGTCGLEDKGGGRFELIKMAVTSGVQGHGIGRLLCERILEIARERGARQVFLETNSRCVPAIALYEKLGFVSRALPRETEFERCDVYMELDLAVT